MIAAVVVAAAYAAINVLTTLTNNGWFFLPYWDSLVGGWLACSSPSVSQSMQKQKTAFHQPSLRFASPRLQLPLSFGRIQSAHISLSSIALQLSPFLCSRLLTSIDSYDKLMFFTANTFFISHYSCCFCCCSACRTCNYYCFCPTL